MDPSLSSPLPVQTSLGAFPTFSISSFTDAIACIFHEGCKDLDWVIHEGYLELMVQSPHSLDSDNL